MVKIVEKEESNNIVDKSGLREWRLHFQLVGLDYVCPYAHGYLKKKRKYKGGLILQCDHCEVFIEE